MHNKILTVSVPSMLYYSLHQHRVIYLNSMFINAVNLLQVRNNSSSPETQKKAIHNLNNQNIQQITTRSVSIIMQLHWLQNHIVMCTPMFT